MQLRNSHSTSIRRRAMASNRHPWRVPPNGSVGHGFQKTRTLQHAKAASAVEGVVVSVCRLCGLSTQIGGPLILVGPRMFCLQTLNPTVVLTQNVTQPQMQGFAIPPRSRSVYLLDTYSTMHPSSSFFLKAPHWIHLDALHFFFPRCGQLASDPPIHQTGRRSTHDTEALAFA